MFDAFNRSVQDVCSLDFQVDPQCLVVSNNRILYFNWNKHLFSLVDVGRQQVIQRITASDNFTQLKIFKKYLLGSTDQGLMCVWSLETGDLLDKIKISQQLILNFVIKFFKQGVYSGCENEGRATVPLQPPAELPGETPV